MRTLPTYFISHGGGPWPWMEDLTNGAYDRLEASLTEMPQQISMTPKAVLVISGHWEERDFTVMSSANPPMIYDYSGFPEHQVRRARLAGDCRAGTRADRRCRLSCTLGHVARV